MAVKAPRGTASAALSFELTSVQSPVLCMIPFHDGDGRRQVSQGSRGMPQAGGTGHRPTRQGSMAATGCRLGQARRHRRGTAAQFLVVPNAKRPFVLSYDLAARNDFSCVTFGSRAAISCCPLGTSPLPRLVSPASRGSGRGVEPGPAHNNSLTLLVRDAQYPSATGVEKSWPHGGRTQTYSSTMGAEERCDRIRQLCVQLRRSQFVGRPALLSTFQPPSASRTNFNLSSKPSGQMPG